MIEFSMTPRNTRLEQLVDGTLSALATPRNTLSVENKLTIPTQLQDIVCQPGLILLSGRPAMGCTSLALNIALSVAKFQRQTVLYFSFDDMKETVMKKLLCIEGMIDTRRLLDKKFTDSDWVRIRTAGALIKDLPLHIYDDPLLTVGEIGQICDRHKQVDLIIIDLLQNMEVIPGEWGTAKRAKKENRILQQLSLLSKKKGIPILCLNMLGGDVERRMCMEPDVCDIRKFRKSFDYIDTALFLYRDDYYAMKTPDELTAFCYVRLNRNNDCSRIRMRWIPEYTTFLDVPFRRAE